MSWHIALGLVVVSLAAAWSVREWARATQWGLPRWPPAAERPLVCESCGRRFPYLTREALPPGLETLGADGLLLLHVRAEHHQLLGFFHGRLPESKRAVVPRPPPEVWHAQRREMLTEDQWRARRLPVPASAIGSAARAVLRRRAMAGAGTQSEFCWEQPSG